MADLHGFPTTSVRLGLQFIQVDLPWPLPLPHPFHCILAICFIGQVACSGVAVCAFGSV